MNANQFATAVNCMDGRVQMPVFEYFKTKHGVDFVDMITEPGPIRTLSENREKIVVESIKRRVEISLLRHNSKLIALVGHHDCAGNPVKKNIQIKQIRIAIKAVGSWKFNAQLIGLWVDKNWEVNEVSL